MLANQAHRTCSSSGSHNWQLVAHHACANSHALQRLLYVAWDKTHRSILEDNRRRHRHLGAILGGQLAGPHTLDHLGGTNRFAAAGRAARLRRCLVAEGGRGRREGGEGGRRIVGHFKKIGAPKNLQKTFIFSLFFGP